MCFLFRVREYTFVSVCLWLFICVFEQRVSLCVCVRLRPCEKRVCGRVPLVFGIPPRTCVSIMCFVDIVFVR